jgi:hypothetical protein
MITCIDTVNVKVTQQEMSQLTQQEWDYVHPWNNPVNVANSTLAPVSMHNGLPPAREVDRINLIWHTDPGPDPWYTDTEWRSRPLEVTRHGHLLPDTVKFWQQYWSQQGCTLGRACLSRILPGHQIYPHVDADWRPDPGKWSGITRYGVVIETNPNCLLIAGDHSIHAEEGTVYYFDKSQLHSAINNGTTPRTHLYMDVFEPKADKGD